MSLEEAINNLAQAINRLADVSANPAQVVDAQPPKNDKVVPLKKTETKADTKPAADKPKSAVSYEEVKAAATVLANSKGRDAVVKVMASTQPGALKLPDIKPENYAKFVQEANKAAV